MHEYEEPMVQMSGWLSENNLAENPVALAKHIEQIGEILCVLVGALP